LAPHVWQNFLFAENSANPPAGFRSGLNEKFAAASFAHNSLRFEKEQILGKNPEIKNPLFAKNVSDLEFLLVFSSPAGGLSLI